jgi:hypothetical protein
MLPTAICGRRSYTIAVAAMLVRLPLPPKTAGITAVITISQDAIFVMLMPPLWLKSNCSIDACTARDVLV